MGSGSPSWDKDPTSNWCKNDDSWPVFSWENDFFEESNRRFKDDLVRVFCDFYNEWRYLLPPESPLYSMQNLEPHIEGKFN